MRGKNSSFDGQRQREHPLIPNLLHHVLFIILLSPLPPPSSLPFCSNSTSALDPAEGEIQSAVIHHSWSQNVEKIERKGKVQLSAVGCLVFVTVFVSVLLPFVVHHERVLVPEVCAMMVRRMFT